MATTLHRPDLGTGSSTNLQAPGTWARYANIALGAWLFISGMLWSQAQGPRINAWVVGVAIAVTALVAIRNDGVRYVNSALAIWLLFSAFAVFRLVGAPLWNDVVVALAVFGLSLVPNASDNTRRRTPIGTAGAP